MDFLSHFKPPFLLLLLILFLVSPSTAHAYLDPGTGSYLLQLFLAGLLGGIFSIKIFWKKIKNLIFKDKKHEVVKE
jgi:hypothetical protein